ncbi:unnamed protein product [Linum tenue]|uniref:Pentatricopeptide repeat-containing protein n=2 Tax=Linum tenue TaxID=586396 RepID=A0AAV0IFS4_9ROSI|nr:unnamed protein product [Linum tenue]
MCTMLIRFKLLLSELSQTHQASARTKQLHAYITRTHLFLDPFFATKIVRLYAGNGDLQSARHLFDKSPQRSVFLWNSMIRAYAQAHKFEDALSLYRNMLRNGGTQPDNFTAACILRAFHENFDEDGLRIVHGEVIVSGLEMDSVTCSALVTAYSKLGLVGEAIKVFYGMLAPDLVLWNVMISGYCYAGFWNKGLQLFREMRQNGEQPDGYTFIGLISGLLDSSLLGIGQGIHGMCLKSGFDCHAHLSSALVTMYSRFKIMNSAYAVFTNLYQPDFVTWSSLITGYVQCGDYEKALTHCRNLNAQGKKLDPILIASLLVAAARSANILAGTQIHGYVVRHGLQSDVMVSSSLIDMYSKCGFLTLGIQLFRSISNHSITSYNTVISCYGLHGLASQAFKLFEEILKNGLQPDESTFSALLCACCHAGLVTHGREIFRTMQDEFRIQPRTEHCVHYVKILGMAGYLDEAYNFIWSLGQPVVDSGIWGALLSCCDANGDSELAEVVAQHLLGNEPRNGAYRVMLSNVYASDGKWEDVRQLRDGMSNAGVIKNPALSMVAV